MNHNVACLIDRAAERDPAKPAIIYYDRRKQSYQPYHYGELQRDSNAYAASLSSRLSPGAKVALLSPPEPQFFAFVMGLFKAGLVPVFLDPAVGLQQLRKGMNDAGTSAIVAKGYVLALLTVLGMTRNRLCIRSDGAWGVRLSQLRHEGRAATLPALSCKATDLATIIFTSGSTGPPKAVSYSHANLSAQLHAVKRLYGIDVHDIDLPTLPVFTFLDLAFGLTSVLANTNTLRPAKAEPARLYEAIQRFAVTTMFASPVLLENFARYGETTELSLGSLKRVISAGAPANLSTIKRFAKLLPQEASLHTPYGATECLPISSISSHELLRTQAQTHGGAGVCLGRPVEGLALHIIGITDAAIDQWHTTLELAPNDVGEIVVAGEHVSQSYVSSDSANTLAKIRAGERLMHRMGDLGYLDDDGRLWFVGRKSQRVESVGKLLFTVATERIFYIHPAVQRCALVAVQVMGKTEAALVLELVAGILRSQHSQIRQELVIIAAQHDSGQHIRHFLFHPRLPVDIRHNSKILREQLSAWAQRRVRA